MAENIVILGAGQALRPTIEILELLNIAGSCNYRIAGALDDNPSLVGRRIHGIDVLGPLSAALKMSDCRFVWALGNPLRPTLRLEIAYRLALQPERFATIVHPRAGVSRHARLGAGVTIQSGVQIAAGVTLRSHVGVGIGAIFEHDTSIGPGSLVAAGVLIAGSTRIGSGVYLGQGCNVVNNVTIGDMSVVGMGAVLLHDVGDGETVVGMPAKVLRTNEIPKEFYEWKGAAGG